MNAITPAPENSGLPVNVEAEQALLGAILTNNKALDRVVEFLQPEHFAEPVHAHIFSTIRQMVDVGRVANPVTLKSHLEADGSLDGVGGTAYIAALARQAVTIINASDYGRLIRDCADRRVLIVLCREAISKASAPEVGMEAAKIVDALESGISEIAFDSAQDGGPVQMGEIVARVVERAEHLSKSPGTLVGYPTGFSSLDRSTGGLERGCLNILAGRPSMGKSALALNIAANVAGLPASADVPAGAVLVFSLEMTEDQNGMRYLATCSGVPHQAIRRGSVKFNDFDRLVASQQATHSLPLFIDATPALTVSAMRARARRLRRKYGGIRLIVIDHLQIVAGSGGHSRNEELGLITAAMKRLAKEMDCPIVLLSQLSRAVEAREDKRPQLSDLRESGNIEQDADTVWFVFREQYYLERSEPRRRADESDDKFNDRKSRFIRRLEEVWNTGEIIVAKNREGPLATIRLGFRGDLSKFENMADQHDDEVGDHG
jgi:replicative DNA helicase